MSKIQQHRVRKNHKPIYAVLWFLEKTNGIKPVKSVQLAELLEGATMTEEIHKKNYNRTCRTLVKHGMLQRFRSVKTGRPAFTLTEKSRAIAEECFIETFKMSLDEFLHKERS